MAGLTGLLPKNTYGDLLQFQNSGAGVAATPKQMSDGLGNTTGLSVGTSWVQFATGVGRLTTSPTNATNTLSSGVLSDLTFTLITGRKYFGMLVLFATNSTAGEGLQFDFNGGGCAITSFQACFAATPPGATLSVVTTTALATALTVTTATTTTVAYTILVGLVCSTGGTIIPRFAENSTHTSGTATALLNSYFWLDDSPN